MRFEFTGKNMIVKEGMKERAIKKLSRLDKILPTDTVIYVTFSEVKHKTKIEVSVPMHKRMLRAEVLDEDVSNCMDTAVDILERQIVKYKTRLRDRRRRGTSTLTNDELQFLQPDEQIENDEVTSPEIAIVRTKKFALKPMDAQEAVMELELLNHDFYVFRNGWTDEINVVYKRKDGEYGLIEPQ